MTSPEGRAGITPGPLQDAVSIDGADLEGRITGLPTLDQATAEQLLKDLYIQGNPKIDNPLADIFAGLRPGVPWSLSIIESLVKAIIGAPSGTTFLSIGHANSLVQAFIGGINSSVTEHTAAIANLNEITAAMGTTAAYVGDLEDMVTCPRSDIKAYGPVIISGPVKNVNILTGFGLEAALGVTLSALPVFVPEVLLFSSVGTIYYTPVVVNRKGDLGKLRWIVGADTTLGSIDYYEMALCVYNPANQNVEKVWGSGNIKDGVASTTVAREVALPMGLNQQTTPGQILFVAHQQVASGLLQAARVFAAKPQGNVGRTPDLAPLDAACFTAPFHSLGIPSSIPFSSLNKENRFLPWAAVTASAIVAP